MKIIDFSQTNSIMNQYMAEMRDKDYQHNRLLFRNNIMRIGELEAYELSKTLSYETREVQTPLGTARVSVPTDKVVLATIFRAGLPFHNGFLNIFDHAGNAFVSAYREYTDQSHTDVSIHVEYLATPDIESNMYNPADDSIEILYGDGTTRSIADASDMFDIALLSRKAKKYFLCYARF